MLNTSTLLALGVPVPVISTGTATWNPADKNAAITLSGGDLIATSSAGTGTANAGVRATVAIPAAIKTYFEIGYTSPASSQYLSLGVMNNAASLVNNMGAGNGAAFCNKFGGNNSYIYINGSAAPGGFPVLLNGQVVRIAVDRTGNKIWWAINNNAWTAGATPWIGSGGLTDDPSTGLGGANISGVTSPIYPAISSSWTGDQLTLNGGTAGFAYSIPTGYTALDGSAPPPPVSPSRAFAIVMG